MALIDRGEIGRGASSRNAGSLHQQLMPFTFREGNAEERRARVVTLPLMAAAGVWQELSRELDGGIELRIVGGLMVAETDEQMAFLADKVALERDQGLDVHMVSGNELRTLAPYLSEAVIGAEYAPGEGKLNPLLAIAGLARACFGAGSCWTWSTVPVALPPRHRWPGSLPPGRQRSGSVGRRGRRQGRGLSSGGTPIAYNPASPSGRRR